MMLLDDLKKLWKTYRRFPVRGIVEILAVIGICVLLYLAVYGMLAMGK